jgi:hypothetical protein
MINIIRHRGVKKLDKVILCNGHPGVANAFKYQQ